MVGLLPQGICITTRKGNKVIEIGERVGAILGAKDGEVDFLGFGVYEGAFVPIEAVGEIAEVLREEQIENPRILLDSGAVVYGCECWWGPQQQIQEKLSVYDKVNVVDIEEIRRKYTEDSNASSDQG